MSLTDRAFTRISSSLSNTLDLSRWVAAVLVLVYHMRVNIFADPATDPIVFSGIVGKLLLAVLNCGQQAVYWFFVISGFLVGGGVLADIKRERFSVERYVFHRFARIYTVLIPALILGLGLDLIRVSLYGITPDAGGEAPASYTVATIIGNLLSMQTIFVPVAGSNIPLWSLANEVSYYILLGLFGVVVTAPNLFRRTVGLGIAACFIVAVLCGNYKILTIFPLFLIGVLVRLMAQPLIKSEAASWAIAIVIFVAYPYTVKYLWYADYLLVALSFANVLLTAQYSDRLPGKREVSVNAWLAGFSFSLYVIHAPILHFVLSMWNQRQNPQLLFTELSMPAVAIFVGIAALVLAVAYAFSRLTEANTDVVRRWIEARSAMTRPTRLEER